MTNEDIGDILGISFDAVKMRLYRARVEPKEVFEAGCEFYRDEKGESACDRKNGGRGKDR